MSRIRDKLDRLHRANPTERPSTPVHEIRRSAADIEAAVRAADRAATAEMSPPPEPPAAPTPTPVARPDRPAPTRTSPDRAPERNVPEPAARPPRRMPDVVRVGVSDVNPSSFRRWKMRRLADDAPMPDPADPPTTAAPPPDGRGPAPTPPVAGPQADVGVVDVPGLPGLAAHSAQPGPVTAHFSCAEHESSHGRCLIARVGIALPQLPRAGAADGAFAREGDVFVDLETSGLGAARGDVVFIVGLARVIGGTLIIEQALADSPERERAAIAWARECLGSSERIITWNGASFDLPFLRARAAAHGLALGTDDPVHVDLLLRARPAWPHLANHRLATVEREILGFERVGDVPGREAPGRFATWQRTGDAGAIAPLVAHNRLDLAVLPPLLAALSVGDGR